MKGTSPRPGNGAIFMLVFLSLSLAACAGLERSSQSGYAQTNYRHQALGREKRAFERHSAREELMRVREAGFYEDADAAISMRLALKRAEQRLVGELEKEQYYNNKPHMQNDRERLRFLQIPSFEARERWLNAKGIAGGGTRHPAQVQALVDINDIAVGFTKQAVRDSWGEPELIEVAGNPVFGHERWHYSEQTSSTDGYRSQKRLIYFESGRVIGWQSN